MFGSQFCWWLVFCGISFAQDPKIEITGDYSYFRLNPGLPSVWNSQNLNGGGARVHCTTVRGLRWRLISKATAALHSARSPVRNSSAAPRVTCSPTRSVRKLSTALANLSPLLKYSSAVRIQTFTLMPATKTPESAEASLPSTMRLPWRLGAALT
jgi:hypothetical protein